MLMFIKHQDRHPKSLVRLRICLPKPIKRERKEKEERKKRKKKKKKNIERDSNSGLLTHKAVSLTIRPWEHEATGLTKHKHTYIHVLSLWRANKDGGDSRGFCALVGEDE